MELNKYIDYTNLKSTSTLKDIEKLCKEAIDNHFETVCVHPYYVSTAKELLKNPKEIEKKIVSALAEIIHNENHKKDS